VKTILTIAHHHFVLPASAAAILKALSGAEEVRPCYSEEGPFKYRALHEQDTAIEIKCVDPKLVGPADPNRDDYGREQVEAEPVESPRALKAARQLKLLGNGGGQ
jgi:hypothetical protein